MLSLPSLGGDSMAAARRQKHSRDRKMTAAGRESDIGAAPGQGGKTQRGTRQRQRMRTRYLVFSTQYKPLTGSKLAPGDPQIDHPHAALRDHVWSRLRSYAMISFTTRPWTSVSRKLRPL